MQQPALKKLHDGGEGRAFLVLFETDSARSYAQRLVQSLEGRGRALLYQSPRVDAENWEALTDSLLGTLAEIGVRQASLVGIGAASVLAQNLALRDIKSVRTLTLIDAACRPHPSFYSNALDWLERSLPMGLPFRHKDRGFYSKPFLQRVRCPTMVVNTSGADSALREESQVLLNALPTAWYFSLSAEDEAQALCDLLLEFETTPAKRPQKNRADVQLF